MSAVRLGKHRAISDFICAARAFFVPIESERGSIFLF